MQFLFNEVFLPTKGLFKNSLSSIYGIGSQRGLYLINSIGINSNLKTKKVSRYKFSILSSLIRKYMLVDASLRRVRYTRLKSFLALNTYKSIRYKSFLPIRGQSTRTNAKTSKKRRSLKNKK